LTMLNGWGLRFFFYNKLFPLRYPFKLIKVPTCHGWLTTFFHAGGLSYIVGRPSDKKIAENITLEEGDVALDIGANVGWYTLMMSRKVGESGKVLAVEPNPTNYAILCRNIRDNKLENVIALQVALSDKDGYARMSMSSNPTAHSLSYKTPDQTKTELVKIMRLDTLVEKQEINKVDFIKIDVEGAEKRLLEGASNTLKIILEMIIESDNTPQRQKTLQLLKNKGYKVTWIDEENLHAKKLASS
jgi:FkbM family methyltransferase